jgi:hypothetical protein
MKQREMGAEEEAIALEALKENGVPKKSIDFLGYK